MPRKIITPTQYLADEFRAVRKQLTKSVRPLFVLSDRRGWPELVGSATLVRVGAQSILLTAAHLIVEWGDRELLIGGTDRLVPIPSELVRIALAAAVESRLDLSVIRLPADVVQALGDGMDYVPEVRLDDRDANDRKYAQCVVGYPLARNKTLRIFDPKKAHVKAEGVATGTALKTNCDYAELNAEPETHIAIRFEPNKLVNVKTGIGTTTAPHPKGMSGGGLFYAPNIARLDNMRLSAILIEYHSPRKLILGIRMSTVLQVTRRDS